MEKLDIIVPHYHEDIHLMDPMLEILRIQRNIDWRDFRILIVCDGEDVTVPEDYGVDMPFEIEVITIPHGGISAARNAGLDYSEAEWIMFCDSDDAFLMTTSLQAYFYYMTEDKSFISSAFMEEAEPAEGDQLALLKHDCHNCIFIHGKVFRRSWLLEHNVRFNNELQLHEDIYFVALVKYLMDEDQMVYINEPLYLWQYNPKSVTRQKSFFVLRTYDLLCKKNSALINEFLRRGMYVPAKGVVCRTITDAYCQFHSKSWNRPENRELLEDAEECVALFLKHYDYIYRSAGDIVIQTGLDELRNRMIQIGEFDQSTVIPFEEWVERLRK